MSQVNSGSIVLESKGKYLMDATKTGASYTGQNDHEECAIREAERLARNNPGKRFLVLKVVGYAEVPQNPPVYTEVK